MLAIKRQKRPTMEAKETYYGGKRDLLWPTMAAKETYYGGKRDLLWRQKRPTMEANVMYLHDAKAMLAIKDVELSAVVT